MSFGIATRRRPGFDEEPYSPLKIASRDRTNEQAQNASFRGTSPTVQDRSQDRMSASQGEAMGGVNPGDYGTGFISGSDQWYGNLNQYGAQMSANDPQAFWQNYGTDVQGWQPGGNAGSFMSSVFNPMAMGAAMYGSKDFTSTEEVLGGSTGIANSLVGNGSNAQFVDPAVLVGNIVNALSSGDAKSLEQVNPMLAAIINQNVGNPAGQIQSLVSFLGQALSGSMPQDMLNAWMSTIERLGSVYVSQVSHGDMKNMDATSFVGFLASQLGPTLGL